MAKSLGKTVPNYWVTQIDLANTGENPAGSPTGRVTIMGNYNYLRLIYAANAGTFNPSVLIFVSPKLNNDDAIPLGINGAIKGEVERYVITYTVQTAAPNTDLVTLFLSRPDDNGANIEVEAPPATQVVVAGSGTTFNASRASVGSAASKIIPYAGTRQQGWVRNLDTIATVYIGGAGVTAATGFPLDPGDSFDVSGSTADVWAITDSATVNVAILTEQ